MKKRVLCFLLTFVLLFGSLPVAFAEVNAPEVDSTNIKLEENSKVSPSNGNKDETQPEQIVSEERVNPKDVVAEDEAVKEEPSFEMAPLAVNEPSEVTTAVNGPITTQEQLESMKKDGNYELGADITLSNWTPFEDFLGTLDGKGYTITLKGTPLFKAFNGTIKNLILDGSVEHTSKTGALAANMNNGLIENCWFKANVTIKGVNDSVGVVGSSVRSSDLSDNHPTMKNILSSGTLTPGRFSTIYPVSGKANKSTEFKNIYWTQDKDVCALGQSTAKVENAEKVILGSEVIEKLNAGISEDASLYKWEMTDSTIKLVPQEAKTPVKESIGTFTDIITNEETDVFKDETLRVGIFGDENGNVGTLALKDYANVEWSSDKESVASAGLYSGKIVVKETGNATLIAEDKTTEEIVARIPIEVYVPENYDLQLKINDVDYTNKSYELKDKTGFAIDTYVSVESGPYALAKYDLFTYKNSDEAIVSSDNTGWVAVNKLEDARVTVSYGNVEKYIDFKGPKAEVNKTALQESINKAKGKVETDYTADSWTNLQTVLTESENLYGNTEATQEQVDAQVTKLEQAIADLVKKQRITFEDIVTKEIKAVENNKTFRTDIFGNENGNVGILALKDHENVQWFSDDKDIITVGINDGKVSVKKPGSATITAKIKNTEEVLATIPFEAYVPENFDLQLKISDVDYTNKSYELKEKTGFEIATYVSVESGPYTLANYRLFTYKNSDKSIVSSDDTGWITVKKLEDARVTVSYGNVEKYIDFKGPKAQVNKTALQESINKAKGKEEADYTADSWTNLQTVLTESENLYGNAEATQEQVDAQVTKLESAITALVEKPVDENTKPTPAKPPSGTEWIDISTAANLKEIGKTGYYRLTNDIIFENGVDITEFNGVLDGNGFSIIRENSSFVPIFDTIGSNGVIQNLGIKGVDSRKVLATTLKGKVLNSYSWQKGKDTNLIDVMEPGAIIYNTYTLPENSTGIGFTGNGGDIINSYWTAKQPFYFDNYQTTLTDSGTKSAAQIKSSEFLATLNENATGFKSWYLGEGEKPQFQEYQPDVLEHPLTFTEYGPTTNVIDITEKGVFRTDVFGNERGYVGKLEVKNYQDPVSWTFESEKDIQPLISIVKSSGEVFVQGVDKGTIIAKDSNTGKELARIPIETFVPDNFDLQLKIDNVDYTGKEYALKGSSGVDIDPFVSVNDSSYAQVRPNLFTWSSNNPKSLNVGTDGSVTVFKEDTATIKASLGAIDKTINLTSEYIPIESIRPNFEGTYIIHRRNPNSIGQNGKPGIADFNPLRNFIPGTKNEDITSQQKLAVVTPENATYAKDYTVTSSNTNVINYHAALQNTLVPYREGSSMITVTSNDPKLTEQKSGTSNVTIEYFNPLTSFSVDTTDKSVKVGDSIPSGLIFKGPKSEEGYHVTESYITYTQEGEGEVFLSRAYPAILDTVEEGWVSSDRWTIKGVKEGKVEVTITPQDSSHGAEPLTLNINVTKGDDVVSTPVGELVEKQLEKTAKYVYDHLEKPGFKSEWSIFGLARANYPVRDGYYDEYIADVFSIVDEEMAKDSKRWGNVVTESQRLSLALIAIGVNPQDIDLGNKKVDLLESIWNKGKYLPGIGNPEIGATQGSNEIIFGLLPTDSHENLGVSKDSNVTRQEAIDILIDNYQNPDGGIGLSDNKSAGVDMTAMAIQALAKYRNQTKVSNAIDKALDYLSKQQGPDGSYGSSESTDQVIVALTELGIDPHTDKRFIKAGNTLVDDLMKYALDDGRFEHVKGQGGNGMATDQGLYALVALDRFYKNKNSLYDMNDVTITKADGVTPNPDSGIPTKEVDKVALKAVIDQGDKLAGKENNYTPDSWTIFQNALKKSKIVYKNQDATQEQVNSQRTELENALKQLKEKPDVVVDYTSLKSAIHRADALADKEKDYTPESWIVLENALKKSKSLYTDPTATQYQVNQQAQELEAAINQLKEKTSDEGKRATSVSVRPGTATLRVGESTKLRAVVVPHDAENKNVLWTSDDNSIATVDQSGNVKAIKEGKVTIRATSQDTGVSDYASVTVEKALDLTDGKTITLSIDKKTIGKGYVLAPTKVKILPGESVWDVTKREMDQRGITYRESFYEQYNSVYIQSIAGDGEFDHGPGSGWMYSVNGVYPQVGSSLETVQGGENVQWRYTTNLGKDIGGGMPDDKTKEQPGETKPPITVPDKDTTTEIKPEVNVDATGKAEVNLEKKEITNAVNQTKKDGSDTLVIRPNIKGNATKVETRLDKTLLEEVNKLNKNVALSVNFGSLKVTSKGLKDLANRGGDLKLHLEKHGDGNLEANILLDGKKINSVNGGAIVTIPGYYDNFTVLKVKDGDTYKTVKKSVVTSKGLVGAIKGSAIVKAERNVKEFKDVPANHWSKPYVDFVASHELFKGIGNNDFGPNAQMTRAMYVTVLYRLEGSPEVTQGGTFKDVPKDTWYTDAVTWGVKEGLIKGDGVGFAPNRNITREELATLMYRYGTFSELDMNKKYVTPGQFKDSNEISNWAKKEMNWALETGLLQGKGNGKLDPEKTATRAEVAAVTKRMIENMVY